MRWGQSKCAAPSFLQTRGNGTGSVWLKNKCACMKKNIHTRLREENAHACGKNSERGLQKNAHAMLRPLAPLTRSCDLDCLCALRSHFNKDPRPPLRHTMPSRVRTPSPYPRWRGWAKLPPQYAQPPELLLATSAFFFYPPLAYIS